MKKQKIEIALKAMLPDVLLTKKQIEEITGLSDNTVVTTINPLKNLQGS
jgi:transcriptional antiterminator